MPSRDRYAKKRRIVIFTESRKVAEEIVGLLEGKRLRSLILGSSSGGDSEPRPEGVVLVVALDSKASSFSGEHFEPPPEDDLTVYLKEGSPHGYRKDILSICDVAFDVERLGTEICAAAIYGMARKTGITASSRGRGRSRRSLEFAHPSEGEFARVLDFYQIRYEYEPKTFPLEWNEDGSVVEAFTPDFYLPDFDLYIELTTLKQNLVAKKNRKIRRFRELYPDIKLKVLYGRDYLTLLKRWGIDLG